VEFFAKLQNFIVWLADKPSQDLATVVATRGLRWALLLQFALTSAKQKWAWKRKEKRAQKKLKKEEIRVQKTKCKKQSAKKQKREEKRARKKQSAQKKELKKHRKKSAKKW
jgi:hypothetical protein